MKIPQFLQTPIDFTKELFQNYSEDDALNLGASLAYYTVFSFAPLIVVIISVAGYFVGEEAIQGRLFEELSGLLGADTANSLQKIVANAYVSGRNTMATVIGLGTLILGATGVFNALKNSLNRVWEIEPRPSSTVLSLVTTRLLSFSFVLGLGFILLVTLALNAMAGGFAEQIASMIPGLGVFVIRLVSFTMSLLITTLIFALLFKFLPDAEVRWPYVWAGGVFTALLFALGKFLIGLYIGNSNFASTYGAAAALITLLVWTYYSSQILFLGAEFTYVWAKRAGHPVRPSSHAVKVIRETRKLDA